MPDSAMATVEPLRVDAVKVAHTPRQIGRRRLDQEMIMIGHQAVRQPTPPKPFRRMAHQRQKLPAVVLVEKNLLSPIPSGGEVIDAARQFYP
jgi:hypothetical protein